MGQSLQFVLHPTVGGAFPSVCLVPLLPFQPFQGSPLQDEVPASAPPAGCAAQTWGALSYSEVRGKRRHSLEEAKESIGLQEHAQEGPTQEHNDYPPQEEAGPLELVPLEEEGKRLPQADDEQEASQEQQLRGREGEKHESKHTTPPREAGARPGAPRQAWGRPC